MFTQTDVRAVIKWNPQAAVRTTDGGVQSPATVLGHAFRAATDLKGYIDDRRARDRAFGNLEERRVITGPETRAARMLGEGVRTNGGEHISPMFTVSSPISTGW